MDVGCEIGKIRRRRCWVNGPIIHADDSCWLAGGRTTGQEMSSRTAAAVRSR
ncbi:hypothetical protein PA257_2735 [Pseudomonas aeruginosa]|nr:hypothetical protein CSB90_4598 [Pseudomonas aeruginosa]AWF61392.1 hypothetical protein CSC30_5837 [Pseudomonas aeruginosa]AZP59616.1 Uncharacterized protein PA1840_2422 [Pseudomonas aeruginosa]QJE91922.1 Uncharacterized protein PA52Ts17_4134 [Pseudomonas aeruginosa]QLJ90055.1 Uncharacterized protein PA52Ts32_4161 [Pseudomonas aeruginosa]